MTNRNIFFTIKKISYSAIFFLALLPVLSFWLMKNSAYPTASLFLSLIFIFLIVPLLDLAIGVDEVNPAQGRENDDMDNDIFYRVMVMLSLPAFFLLLLFGHWVFVSNELNFWQQAAWILTIGVFGSVFGINSAHELCHKTTKIEPFFSGLLLSLVCYSTFKIEHIRGHHVYVSTPDDKSSARLNQTVYNFLWGTFKGNFISAFRLEKNRLNKKGLSAWHWRNELIWWQATTLLWILLVGLIFGGKGILFFLLQSFVAISFLEVINYVEHYGLERKRLKNGKYEPVTHKHSWNSSFLLTNLLLFQLQRHSDHHANPKIRYQVLRHFHDSPQLPFGYATMILLTLLPPLWFFIMNPRVKKYLGESGQPEILGNEITG